MRRRAWVVTVSLGTVLLAATATVSTGAWAAPSPVAVPSAVPGATACTMDKEVGNVTGLTLGPNNGYAVTVHGDAVTRRVYLLTNACKIARSWGYNAPGANDPQDIQAGPDGTYWVADTGDNPAAPARGTVALWKFTAAGASTLYRLKYPDKSQSAQALLMSGNTPIIITDNPAGPAGVYEPAAALDPAGKPVPLKSVGTFTPQNTGTENKLGPIGTSRVTGAATSHDGKKVAIRTFADAYEWDVPNGDVVAAITTGTPRITPLPNEPQGTAIAYTADNASFLTASDVAPNNGQTQILKYKASPPVPAAKATQKVPTIATKGDTRSWFAKLNLQDLLRIVGAVGVVGLLMVVGGIIGIRRARKKPPRSGGNGRRMSSAEDDLTNQPAVAMAQVSVAPRDRYDSDGFDPPGRYPMAEDRPPPPPADGVYGRPVDPDAYGAPRRGVGPSTLPPRGGIARSHRPGNRRPRERDVDPNRRGYSDQHDGFRDMLEE